MKKSSFLFILLINIILINTLFAYYGAKYLIIAPDNFVSELQQFADWKTKKGIKTMIVPLSVTGSSASQIKNYILNAYNNWQIRPEYILLAGHGSVLATSGSSDDYFADMGGSYLIELSIGRLPASNLDQLRNIVNKTLNYERYPYLTDTLWFRKGMTIVREDYSGYPPTQYPDTYYWENARYVFTQWLRNGYVYVDSLSKNRGHSSTDIVNGITDGRAYVLFRGQSTTNWWTPFSTEPNNCNNGYKLPVVVSGTCATMSLSSTGYAADRFINAGSVTTPKGSVGFFASTMTSSGSGLAMQRGTVSVGFFRSVFEDKVYAMGDAAKRAKFILDSIQPAGYSSDRYREWNLFGDPTLQLWTDAPKPMLVLYDSVIPSTQSSLQITVRNQNNNAVPNALVCLRMDTIIYTWGYTNMQGLINLSFTPQASGIMDITVTAPNYIPFENTIRFIPANQPYINIVSYNFTEQLGNNDGKINPGEQIQLSVILRNDGNISAPNVQAYLRTNNPYITIQDSLCEYGTIAVGESVISQQIYRFWVSSNCRNNEQITFQLHIQDAQARFWDRQINTIVYAGKINLTSVSVIDPPPGGNNNSTIGQNEAIKLTTNITNIGENLNRVSAILRTTSPYISITDSQAGFGNILHNASASNSQDPFAIVASPTLPKNYPISLTMFLIGNGGTYYYRDTINFIIVSENGSTNDPTGPDNYGYWAYDNTDSLSGQAPTYNWFEIGPGGPGSLILEITNQDAAVTTLRLPFTFKYYGQNYDSISVCSNGFLAMGRTSYRFGNNTTPIPDTSGPAAMIAPLWCDLDPSLAGDIYQYYDATNYRWIVEFYQVPMYNQATNIFTFQTILYNPIYYPTPTGDGIIEFIYHTFNNPSSVTVGIENQPQTIGIQYMRNNVYSPTSAFLTNGRAVRFSTQSPNNLNSPWITLNNGIINDSLYGNNNGIPEPNEIVDFVMYLQNRSNISASNVSAIIRSLDGNVIITDSITNLGTISPSAIVNNLSDPFRFQVVSNPTDSILDFILQINATNYSAVVYFSIPMLIYNAILETTAQPLLISQLYQNAPNPFSNLTQIKYTLPTAQNVQLKIYNSVGTHIKTLVNQYQNAGEYIINWDRTDFRNQTVPKGIYFYTLITENKKQSRKMVIY